MRALIVEDDPSAGKILKKVLSAYGQCEIVVNGLEGVTAFRNALDAGQPYDLICMDIMMPELDGQEALHQIREHESKIGIDPGKGVHVFMTTALSAPEDVSEALFKGGAAAFFVKPIHIKNFIKELKSIGLVEQ